MKLTNEAELKLKNIAVPAKCLVKFEEGETKSCNWEMYYEY